MFVGNKKKETDKMQKKKITVVSLDPRAGASYAGEVQSLFGDYADISMFNVMDGSAMRWPGMFLSGVRQWQWKYLFGGMNCES